MMQATDAVVRSYEEICEDSRIAVGQGDAAAWRIGDNAVEIAQRYSEITLADYAREIGKPKGTVYEAHSMSVYWDTSARAELSEFCPNVTRSHMRKVLSIKDREIGRWAVEKCSERGWTVDQFGFILKRYKRMAGLGGKPTPPKAERRVFPAIWDIANGMDTEIEIGDTIDNLMRIHPDARITVVIEYEVQS